MNKRNIVFFICMLVSFFGYGQYCFNDSLVSVNLIDNLNKNSALKLLNTAYFTNNFDRRLEVINKVYTYSKKNNFLIGMGKSHVAYASSFYEKGDYVTAMEHCINAVKVLESTDDAYTKREARNCMAKLERENKNFKKGISICLELIEELSSEEPTEQLARIYLNAANIFMNFKDDKFQKAAFYLNESKKIFEALHCDTGVALVNVKYGRYYKILFLKTKDHLYLNKVVNYTNDALVVFEKENQYANLAYVYYTKATAYSIAGKHKTSLVFYDKALENYKKVDNLIFVMRVKQHLFVAYSILNNHEKALESNNEYVALKDSIFNIEKRKLIIDSQTKFETEKIKNQKELAELQSKKNKKMFFLAIIISGLIFLTALFYFDKLKSKKKAELITVELKETQKRLAIEKQYRDSELKALKAQMNPHFIFNALNSIQDYIVLNQKNLASDYLGKFADLIRNYLHFSDTGFISVPDEVHNLNLYLELEKLRFEDKLEYTFTVDDAANSDTIKIPTMLIQPYVENALKHGLLHKKEHRKLEVSIVKISEQVIECIIEDNGIGREKSRAIKARRQEQHKSFALKATTERLDLLNYGREKKIGVEIIDLKENNMATGTRVILKIPILKK